MNILLKLGGISASLVLLAGCNRSDQNQSRSERQINQGQPIQERAGAENKQADNTGKNVRDRNDATLTPGDQGNSDGDRDITRRIRRAISSNDQLSTTAKNIKIITVDGKVTLRGPVKNEEEKNAIANAVQQAGITTFDNQLEVKNTNQ